MRIARTQGGTAPAGGGDKAGAGGPFEQGTARDGRRTHGVRRRRLDDLVHNNLRDRWLYPPGLQSAPSDRHQRAASSASTIRWAAAIDLETQAATPIPYGDEGSAEDEL